MKRIAGIHIERHQKRDAGANAPIYYVICGLRQGRVRLTTREMRELCKALGVPVQTALTLDES